MFIPIAVILIAALVVYYFLTRNNERFNPRYGMTYHQSTLNQQNDYMRDPAGYTNDDYFLTSILNANHAVGGGISP